jgi:hypothetical protein
LNTAVGSSALRNNTTVPQNVAIDVGAGTNVVTAFNVIAIGILKEHRAFVKQQHEVENLMLTVANLVAMVKEQATLSQKVNAQPELNKSAPQRVTIDN